MKNQQLHDLSREQLQVLLTGKFGDGHLTAPRNINSNSRYSTNCIHLEYLEFKRKMLGDIAFDIGYNPLNGFAQKPIYSFNTKHLPEITYIRNLDVQTSLTLLDDLGLALWFYDDGSLHKNKLFYNLNTQSFSEDIQEELFIPFLSRFNMKAKVTIERKLDGRIFHYLRTSKYEGAYEMSKLLQKYYVNCYSYKIWNPVTIQKWSKLQEELRNTPKTISNKMMGVLLNKIILECI